MALVDQFIERYVKEFDYYDQVGRIAARRLEASLEGAGVRAIVTSRAKSPTRLAEKVHKRHAQKSYRTVADIYNDIVDLAGVRVALYFPGDRERVDLLVRKDFTEVDSARTFPEPPMDPGKRFSGYAASHYRVQLRPGDLDQQQERYALARIEIQVASVLMHAWSEVEHDLAYKPTQGQLSDRELGLLDQLNGLVLAGEIALEQLQTAGQERVAEGRRLFTSHFDLAAYLLQRARELELDEVSAEGLGRVDLLFQMLRKMELSTPEHLAPYVDQLHNDIERRPLADQIIDAMLAEDSSRYGQYADIRNMALIGSSKSTAQRQSDGVGQFITQWIRLEKALREANVVPPSTTKRGNVPTSKDLFAHGVLDAGDMIDFDQLRRMRNNLVHGVEVPPNDVLHAAAARISAFIDKLKRVAGPSEESH